jgi:hypothetical protein
MNDIKPDDTADEKRYEEPTIEDHGDLTDLTAGLSSGAHVDGTFTYGQLATFISGP